MSASQPPKVSVVIPVLNAGGLLGNCLGAIRRQNYPKECVEILVADGGSADDSRAIASAHGAVVLDNPRRGYDTGKSVALAAATGEYIVFIDADNELTHPDFLQLAIKGLQENPQALGVESYYLASPRMTSFCAYLTQLLHISDPVSRRMSASPVFLGCENEIERWTFAGTSLAWPMGANGFVFRRADLEATRAPDIFEDTHVVLELVRQGKREWLRIRGRGVHHYYVRTVCEFMKKRRRQAFHFLSLRHKQGHSWTRAKPSMPAWAACLVCGTVFIPLVEAAVQLVRTGDLRWLWHPVASLVSVLGLFWGVATFFVSGHSADTEAGLQPIQRIDGKS